jgi:hypothetical protein
MSPLSNAERQARWRERQKEKAGALDGKPKEVAERVIGVLGVAKAKKVSRALDKRLKAIKPDCPVCQGTGNAPLEFRGPCGTKEGAFSVPCDCGPLAEEWLRQGNEWAGAAAAQQRKLKRDDRSRRREPA